MIKRIISKKNNLKITKIIYFIMDASLSSNDLVNILKIIEICTQRGGFRAIELKGVGEIYEKKFH